MASYEKAVAVERHLTEKFWGYITGSAVVPDERHGYVVKLYRTQNQVQTAIPPIHNGVKVLVEVTDGGKKNK